MTKGDEEDRQDENPATSLLISSTLPHSPSLPSSALITFPEEAASFESREKQKIRQVDRGFRCDQYISASREARAAWSSRHSHTPVKLKLPIFFHPLCLWTHSWTINISHTTRNSTVPKLFVSAYYGKSNAASHSTFSFVDRQSCPTNTYL